LASVAALVVVSLPVISSQAASRPSAIGARSASLTEGGCSPSGVSIAPIGRDTVIARASTWVDDNQPYVTGTCASTSTGYYRQDCSGFVSMAWGLPSSLDTYEFNPATDGNDPTFPAIDKSKLQPGDALVEDGGGVDHIALFVGWGSQDQGAHRYANLMEESEPGVGTIGPPTSQTVNQDVLSGYWGGFTAITYTGLGVVDSLAGGALADINGDGKADLIAVKPDGEMVDYVGSGNVSAPFSAAAGHTYTFGSGWNGFDLLMAGDINGDHKADVVGRKPDGTLWDYIGNGVVSSPFSAATGRTYEIGKGYEGFTALALGDINGDGKADLIARKSDGTLVDYIGNGSASAPFSAATGRTYQIGTGYEGFDSISMGDLNGDKHADLIVRKPDGTLIDYIGNGSVSKPFSAATGRTYSVGRGFDGYAWLRLADLNGDKHADLLGITPGGDVTEYKGTGSTSKPYSTAAGYMFHSGSGYSSFTQIT